MLTHTSRTHRQALSEETGSPYGGLLCLLVSEVREKAKLTELTAAAATSRVKARDGKGREGTF